MIKVVDNHFILETSKTSYIITYTESGLLLHDYYGEKVEFVDFECIRQKLENGRQLPFYLKIIPMNLLMIWI